MNSVALRATASSVMDCGPVIQGLPSIVSDTDFWSSSAVYHILWMLWTCYCNACRWINFIHSTITNVQWKSLHILGYQTYMVCNYVRIEQTLRITINLHGFNCCLVERHISETWRNRNGDLQRIGVVVYYCSLASSSCTLEGHLTYCRFIATN